MWNKGNYSEVLQRKTVLNQQREKNPQLDKKDSSWPHNVSIPWSHKVWYPSPEGQAIVESQDHSSDMLQNCGSVCWCNPTQKQLLQIWPWHLIKQLSIDFRAQNCMKFATLRVKIERLSKMRMNTKIKPPKLCFQGETQYSFNKKSYLIQLSAPQCLTWQHLLIENIFHCAKQSVSVSYDKF